MSDFFPRLYQAGLELLYDWRFTAYQFILATGKPLETHDQYFFFSSHQHLRSYSLRNILSDETIGLSFKTVAGPRQRSRSQVRVSLES
jgi:hypothetical protein